MEIASLDLDGGLRTNLAVINLVRVGALPPIVVPGGMDIQCLENNVLTKVGHLIPDSLIS